MAPGETLRQPRGGARYRGCVWFAALAAGLCLAIVVFTPGGPRRLWRAPLLSWWMLVLGVALQLIVAFVDFPTDRIDDAGFALLMASYALLLAFCFVNIRLPGMWLVAAGLVLNTVVVGLNQGMPTADQEQTTASGATVDRPIERTVKQRPESDDDILGFLGDVVELPGPLDSTISIGDIAIVAGALYFSFRTTRRPKEEVAATATAAPVVAAKPHGEFEDFWSGEPGGEATGELPVVVDAPDADAQLAALESAPLDLDAEPEPDIAPEIAALIAPTANPGAAPEPEPDAASDAEPPVISWHDDRGNGASAAEPPDEVAAALFEADDDWPVVDTPAHGTPTVARERPSIEVDPPPTEAPAATPAEPAPADAGADALPRSIDYDDDELERKLAASEHDPTMPEHNRPPRFVPAPPAPPTTSDAEPPAAAPTPAPAPKPTPKPAPKSAPAAARSAPKPAPAPKPAADVADDPLAAELEKLFSKLSRGPGEADH